MRTTAYLLLFSSAALLLTLVAACDPGTEPSETCERHADGVIDVRPLVFAEDWSPASLADDPLADHQPTPTVCPVSAWGDEFGTLEASNTDGLRTLLRTTAVPDMKEKTLRYPGHFEYMRVLLESGFFGKEPIEVGGAWIRPIDFTARLLFPLWRLAPGEADLTVMRVRIRGEEGGKKKEHVYRLFDRLDEKTGVSSRARTTGYTCTAVVNLLLDGRFTRKGICAPEAVGAEPGCLSEILDYLSARGVRYEHEETG